MKLSFRGAAGEVGRSCIMVENGRRKTLLDCGVKFEKEDAFPVLEDAEARKLDAVYLTHAHMDHSGYLPALYSAGYKGKVFSTKPTRDLTQVLLADYLRLDKGVPYKQDDVIKCLKHMEMLEYGEEKNGAAFRDAGHILGSATVTLKGAGGKTVLYTGDITLRESRLLDGAPTDGYKADALIIESTYGGHDDKRMPLKQASQYLANSIRETFKKKGKVIVPTFAIGRGQEILFTIDSHMRSGTLEQSPIYVDGMINKALRIYRHNAIYLRKEIQRRILTSDDDPFKSENYRIPERKDRSDVFEQEKAIIVTTSGMLNGGPVLTYLKKLAPHKQNKIILVGYQAKGTRGRDLLEGADELQIDRQRIPVNLEVDETKFSAHSDQRELLEFVACVKGLKRVFIVHGEKEKSEQLAEAIHRNHRHLRVDIPKLGEEFSI